MFSNYDGNMCSVLIKFLVTMFINLIFKYVYLEIGSIILDLSLMVNCPHHENVYEFTPWILIAINKRKKMKSHSICIHNLFYERQLNLTLVINVKWLYHAQSFRKKASWGWLNHEPQALGLSFFDLVDIASLVFQICIMKTY